MNNNDPVTQAETEIQQLELKIEELLRNCAFLKEENHSLRTRQDSLVAERASLIEKTEMARSRVEDMITRLKALETNT